MSFDGLFTYHMNKELQTQLINGRINKIYQPSNYEIVMILRANRQTHKLFFSIHPMQARYHLTEETFFNPDTPPNFCMVLRKYLEGAILKNITQLELDRVTTFHFENRNELGDLKKTQLVIELMGKHSNLFLLDTETKTIIDCLKHVPYYKNTFRTLLPNATYQLPPHQTKVNPLALSNTDLEKKVAALANEDIKTIQSTFQGLSRSTIQWIKDQQTKHAYSLAQALALLQKVTVTPSLLTNDFMSLPVKDAIVFSTLSQLLDRFYLEKSKSERLQQLSGNLIHQLTQLIKKNQLKYKNLQVDLQQAEDAEIYRIKAELLMSYPNAIQKGSLSVQLPNFYNDNQLIDIDLQPHLSSVQNAQSYFKKYQKFKQAVHHLQEQIELTYQELDYLETILVQIDMSEASDLVLIRDELIANGYLKANKKALKKAKVLANQPLQFKASDGTIILVGRNNLQNDQLTLKIAKKNYIWLHTKNIPGSHVIITTDNPSEETLYEAAQLAAYYSKFQQSSNVPVDYVVIKNIRKPNGSKPGFVIYEQQKTILVTPSKEFVDSHRLN